MNLGEAKKKMRRLITLIALLFVVACAAVAGPSARQDGLPPPGMGRISGTVLRAPVLPVEVPGSDNSAPVAGAKVIVTPASGSSAAASASTDSAGKYRLFVTPGRYVVTLDPTDGFGFATKDLPATVTVMEGQTTALDIRIDTGIR